jgi:hypothetical protein
VRQEQLEADVRRTWPETKASVGLRQSDRVGLRMPVEVSWATSTGVAVKHIAETLLVSRNGGVVRLDDKLPTGQEPQLRRSLDGDQWKSARARVVAEIDQEPPHHFIYAIQLLDPDSDFWNIACPSPQAAEEVLARLLMECSFCQSREVVYMNEMDLKSFEIRKCVARICKKCNSPSIWIDSLSEARTPDDPAAKPVVGVRRTRRNHTRVKARILCCLRRRAL